MEFEDFKDALPSRQWTVYIPFEGYGKTVDEIISNDPCTIAKDVYIISKFWGNFELRRLISCLPDSTSESKIIFLRSFLYATIRQEKWINLPQNVISFLIESPEGVDAMDWILSSFCKNTDTTNKTLLMCSYLLHDATPDQKVYARIRWHIEDKFIL